MRCSFSGRSLMFGAALIVGAGAIAPAALAEKTLLRVRLDGAFAEAPNPNAELMKLFGEESNTHHSWLKLIDKATADSKISGMILIVENPAVGLAQTEEMIRALKKFRAAGKKIHAFIDGASNAEYALASAADDITLVPYGQLDTMGLHVELMFYKGLFDKIGVNAQMLHCGAYKSALEPYTRTEPSKEAAENVNWLLDGIYNRWVAIIAENRKLTVDKVQAAVDSAPIPADAALQQGLIDHIAGWADFKQRIQKEYGKDVVIKKRYAPTDALKMDFDNPFAIFTMIQEAMEKASKPLPPGVGLVYVAGAIVDGRAVDSPFSGQMAAGTNIRAALDAARLDETIKAVVLRVDLPGGSAMASDIIWDAATRCAAEKPLIVSMGSVAGSGGYYVAIPGDTIFAEESTITGSIGVVGGKLCLKGLMEEKLGITVTEFNRGKHAGMFAMAEPWSESDMKEMQGYLDRIYDQFKGRVTQSRGKKIKGDLESLAGGRVYTGRQALEKGLIDEIGGLSDAIALAAKKAGLQADCDVRVLPRAPDFGDILKKLAGEETTDEWEFGPNKPAAVAWPTVALHGSASDLASSPLLQAMLPLLQSFAPEQAQVIRRDLSVLSILQAERAACFMPLPLILR